MPISSGNSSGVASLERKRSFYIKGGAASTTSIEYEKANESFLTIEPALPQTDPPRLPYKRSNSTLGVVRSSHDRRTFCIPLQHRPDGSVHASRTPDEKEKAPDRLNLDTRGLTALPTLEDEPHLRLLSLQHNLIDSLDGFKQQSFPFLVFLDMYDNQLERMRGLEHLHNLRVLLIGKNRIKKIEGLEGLTRIEVLDLHGNQISQVGGLTGLGQLKVLNLAGNQIRSVGAHDLKGLACLQELNLRRNRLKKLLGFAETPSLQKLFLNNNEVHAVEDMCSVAKATGIREISIEHNPISLGGDCVSFLVSYLSQLALLNGMQITEQVRRAAMAWRRNKEASNAAFMDLTSDVCLNVRREEVISNARTNWELLRSQTRCLTAKSASGAPPAPKNLRPDCDFILTSLTKPDFRTGGAKTRALNHRVPLLPDKGKMAARTCSQDTDRTSSSGELFRLPPILVPIVGKLDGLRPAESLSSIGPNVDSSASDLLTNSESGETDSEGDGTTDCSESEVEEKTPAPNPAPALCSPPERRDEAERAEKESTGELKAQTSASTDNSSTISTATAASSTSQAEPNNSTSSSSSLSKHNRPAKSAVKSRPAYSKVRTGRPVTAKPRKDPPTEQPAEKDREQGGDYLIEICGRHLNIYGQSALRLIDKPWSTSKAKDVTTVRFSYASFNSIAGVLAKLKQRFPNADTFLFRDTNLQHLGQLNALAELRGLVSLAVDDEGNPVARKPWQSYAVYRLSHWGLRTLNGRDLTEEDVRAADREYRGLGDLVMRALPSALLQPLLARLQLDVGQKDAKRWLQAADPALRAVVVKEALQWRQRGSAASQEDAAMRQRAKTHIGAILGETCDAVGKLRKLDDEWPTILHDTVRNILLDYTQMEMYMRRKLHELK